MNTAVIASWNDCDSGCCVLPTYKVSSRGEFERDGEKMLLDTGIIDALHSALGGENIDIERTAQGKPAPGTTPNTGETQTPYITPDYSAGHTDIELPDSTANDVGTTGQASRTAQTSAKPTPKATEKTSGKNTTQKIINAGITTFILLAGTVVYAVLARRKKKDKE